ncbi:MAG: NUDIX domain-containing protein [Thermomicrobiales bacterium]|nr:NUDIX domain-containing protein [Thermomicrobiales bacterium]
MPRIVSDIVDVYVFRRLNARVQFLLLQRQTGTSMGGTWQAFHSQIRMGDTTLQTVKRVVQEAIELELDDIYSADYINQFYDEGRDAMVLSPVFAVTLKQQSPVRLAPEFHDAAWFDRQDATIRLPFSGQRWAIRHIDEIMGTSEEQRAIYKLDADIWQPTQGIADSVSLPPEPVTDDSIDETYDEFMAESDTDN